MLVTSPGHISHASRRGRRVLGALIASAVLAAASCQNPFARDQRTDLQVLYEGTAPFDLSLVRVQAGESPIRYQLEADEFGTSEFATPHTQRLRLPSDGELAVRVSLVAPTDDTLAMTRITLLLRPDYHFGIGIRAGGSRPLGVCVGTIVAAPLRRPGDVTPLDGDTLFVSYAGLPDGAIC